MIQLTLFLLLTTVYSQFTCMTAESITSLPNFNVTATFGEYTTESKIKKGSGTIETVYSRYYVIDSNTTTLEDVMITLETCSVQTTIPSKIYIFETCTEEYGDGFLYESGYDPNCKRGYNFPTISFIPEKGKTYYIALMLLEQGVNGVVELHGMENMEETFDNKDCKSAIEITKYPFESRQQLINSKISTSKPNCYNQASPTLWYKLKGEGKQMLVSTCNYYTSFDTRIVVVKGNSDNTCENQECVADGDDGCGTKSKTTILAFKAEQDVEYYIGVSGNLKDEGQYQLVIDYLSSAIPTVCENALPIQQIPFTKQFEILHDWPASKGQCFSTNKDVRSVFLSFTGIGKTVVFSTCKSLDSYLQPIGAKIELINNCQDNQCAIVSTEEYGYCGENMYLMLETEKDKNYIIRTFCDDTSQATCDVTLNVYEKAESHDTCEHARILEDPGTIQEIADVDNLQTSYHGCSGVAEEDVGLWYKFVHDTTKSIEIYTVVAMNAQRSKIGWIELPYECMSFNCEKKVQGEVRITFTSRDTYQYIFVYPDTASNQQGLIVQFINEENVEYNECSKALDIELPYTALHTFQDSKSALACTQTSLPANFYKFHLTSNLKVDVSTCFTKTLVDTGIEISKGCVDKGGYCIQHKKETNGCPVGAASMQVDLDKDIEYTLAVYLESKGHLNVKQYRMVIFTEEVPANSICTSPTELNYKKSLSEYMVLNRYGRQSDFGSTYGQTRGSYFHIKAPVKITMTVRTCSSATTTNSFIVTATSCKTEGKDDSIVSKPDGLANLAKASEVNCDIHGTYSTFDIEANEDRYIFVGPESFNTDCFINAEFHISYEGMDEDTSEDVVPEETSEKSSSDEEVEEISMGWVIFGSIFYVYSILVVVLVIVCIVIRRKLNSYQTLE